MGLFVQLVVLFLVTSGQHNLNGTCHSAPEEAELKDNSQRQAGMMPCTQAVRSSREKLLCTNEAC